MDAKPSIVMVYLIISNNAKFILNNTSDYRQQCSKFVFTKIELTNFY